MDESITKLDMLQDCACLVSEVKFMSFNCLVNSCLI